ncbi:hypothetical protein [Brasilonema sp. UFV-L1]|uniref:hypothetical protein n=1 Tax=Brasilonema sp. UFV-L1 TaxID=2234130 RepID=UPI00145D5F29|nr:hypothetical protein [Brasilonema sp. UFV-L1]
MFETRRRVFETRRRVFETRRRVFETRRRVFETRRRVFRTRRRVFETRRRVFEVRAICSRLIAEDGFVLFHVDLTPPLNPLPLLRGGEVLASAKAGVGLRVYDNEVRSAIFNNLRIFP